MNTIYPVHRDDLGPWLNRSGLVGHMAEIGCAFGGFAELVLKEWEGVNYIMVDPWVAQDPATYRERQEEPAKYLAWFEQVKGLAARDGRIKVMRQLSHEAAPLVPDGSLDCCYIDGNHSREAVALDLELWWPKVKKAGVFGGHDFYNATEDGHWCQVEEVVGAWAREREFRVHRSPCSSWWVRKWQ